MPDTLCRLAIHVVGGADGPAAADVLLPTDCPVGVLIPSIVDLAVGDPGAMAHPHLWQLRHLGGELVDTSITLRENGVHDGDLILLTTTPPPAPTRRSGDPSGVVAEVVVRAAPSAVLHEAVPSAVLAVTLVSAATLAWTGSTGGTAAHLWTAATLSAATALVAVGIGRSAGRLSVTSSPGAVAFAMVCGSLAVPDAPWPARLVFASSCAFAISILLLRMACGGTTVLTALAAVTVTLAGVGVFAVVTTPPWAAVGGVLTVMSLAGLSVAPKLTVAAAGLGPSRADVGHRRAVLGHRILTGLVAGWSFSAALGVVAVAADPAASPVVAALFAADVGLLLLLRQRSHIDAQRRVALAAAGLCAVLATHLVAIRSAPEHAYWLCAATALAGTVTLRWTVSPISLNPVVRQSIQILEYLALAAVVPLAAWVTGGYGLVRTLSLS